MEWANFRTPSLVLPLTDLKVISAEWLDLLLHRLFIITRWVPVNLRAWNTILLKQKTFVLSQIFYRVEHYI